MSVEPSARIYDVIIAGAGPTGLTLANLLGLRGLSVLVVERNTATVREPRAVSIDDESLRTMQAAGIIEQVMAQVVRGYGSRYLTPRGNCFLTVMPTGRPYGYLRRNAFRQPILEQQLRDGLKRFAHVETRFGSTVSGFVQDMDCVNVSIACDGEQLGARGLYLVGCDGASSTIRKLLGVKLEGETLPERWMIIDLADSPADRDTVVFCDIDRPCIALPGPDQTRRFEFKLRDHETEGEMLRPERVQALLASRGAAAGSRTVRQVVYTFHARIADRWAHDRVFLAGDAAHLMPPFAGQGMNSGIRDAHNLAWKLAEVVTGRIGESLLHSYETERRGHVAAMIDLALRMGRIMGPPTRLRGWVTQTAFRAAGLWPELRAYFGEMKYKPQPRFSSGFLLPSAHTLVGRLLPQPVVRSRDGFEQLLDDALPDGFVLVGLDMPPVALKAAARQLDTGKVSVPTISLFLTGPPASDLGGASLSLVDPPDRALAAASGSLLLVRPDRYVMAAFPAGKVADVAGLFKQGDSRNSARAAGRLHSEGPLKSAPPIQT